MTEAIAVADAPETGELRSEATNLLSDVKGLPLVTPEQRQQIGEIVAGAKRIIKIASEKFQEPKRRLDAAKKALLDLEKDVKRIPEEIVSIGESRMRAFDENARRVADQIVRKLNEDRLRQAEEEALSRAAAIQAEGGDPMEALASLDEPLSIAPAIVQPAIKKAEGESSVEIWKFQIENQALIPREYLMADEKKIGGVVRASKGTVKIAGVKAYSEISYRQRG